MGRKRSERNVSLYGIYDIREDYMCVGIFNPDEAVSFLGITYSNLYRGVRDRNVIRGRYLVERVKKGKKVK